MPETAPCPHPQCHAEIKIGSTLRPSLCQCLCHSALLRYYRESAPFGGSVARLRLATPEERAEFFGEVEG